MHELMMVGIFRINKNTKNNNNTPETSTIKEEIKMERTANINGNIRPLLLLFLQILICTKIEISMNTKKTTNSAGKVIRAMPEPVDGVASFMGINLSFFIFRY
jgi:hypothetical protein